MGFYSVGAASHAPARFMQHRGRFPLMMEKGHIDTLVVAGDAAALVAYGAVQSVVDVLLSPIAQSQPDLFTQNLPVESPLGQGGLIALAWMGAAFAFGDYCPSTTRVLPAALVALLKAWLTSCVLVLGACALAQQLGLGGPGTSQAELDFVFGSGTVVGAWRMLCAAALPPPTPPDR